MYRSNKKSIFAVLLMFVLIFLATPVFAASIEPKNGIHGYDGTVNLPRQASLNSLYLSHERGYDYRDFLYVKSQHDDVRYDIGKSVNLQPGAKYTAYAACRNVGQFHAKNVRMAIDYPDVVAREETGKLSVTITSSNTTQKIIANTIDLNTLTANQNVKIMPKSVSYHPVDKDGKMMANKTIKLKDSEAFSKKGAKIGSFKKDGIIYSYTKNSKKRVYGSYGIIVEFEFEVVSAEVGAEVRPPKNLGVVDTPTPISPRTGKPYDFTTESIIEIEPVVYDTDGTKFKSENGIPQIYLKEGSYKCVFHVEMCTELKDVGMHIQDYTGDYRAGASITYLFNMSMRGNSNKTKREFPNNERGGNGIAPAHAAKDINIKYDPIVELKTSDGKARQFNISKCLKDRSNGPEGKYKLLFGKDMDGFANEGDKFTVTVVLHCTAI